MQRYKTYISVLFFLVIIPNYTCQANYPEKVDSLLQVVNSQEDNTEKVKTLLALAQVFKSIDQDSALMFCDQVYAISNALDYKEGIAEAYYKKSLIYKKYSNFNAAIEYAYKTMDIVESLQDSMFFAKINYQLANLIKTQSNNKPALDHYMTALGIYINKKDTSCLIAVYNGLGNYFLETGIYNLATTYFYKSLHHAEAIGRKQSQGKILGNLGTVYLELGEYDNARKYLNKGIEITWKYPDNNEKANALTRLGNLELNCYNFTKVYEYYHQADSIFREVDDSLGIHNCYVNFAYLFLEQGNYKQSIKNFDTALVYYKKQGVAKGKIAAWQGKATAYTKLENFDTALLYYDSCLQLAYETDNLSRKVQVYTGLYGIYQAKGDFKKALISHTLLGEVEDSIYNLKNTLIITDLNFKYDRNQYLLNQLKKDNIILKTKKQLNALIYTGLGIFLLAIYLIFFFRYRAKKNQVIAEQKIKRLEEEKKLLAARFLVEGQENERKRIATEIHDSLGVLLSTSKMHISAIKDSSPENKALIDKATRFLDEASGEMRKISHNMMPGLLSKLGLCEALEDLFDTLNDAEGIDARMEVIGPKKRLPENKEIMIYRVVQEMVNNTLKHAKAGKISLTIIIHPDQLNMSYSDDGKGFDVNKIPGQKTMGVQGIRSRVKFLDGTIKIDSSPDNGVVYRINVPLKPDGTLTSV